MKLNEKPVGAERTVCGPMSNTVDTSVGNSVGPASIALVVHVACACDYLGGSTALESGILS